eukprot:scaffold8910_cov70-Phaeocystis_antarctica.AAC.2
MHGNTGPLGAQPLARVLELAASKAAPTPPPLTTSRRRLSTTRAVTASRCHRARAAQTTGHPKPSLTPNREPQHVNTQQRARVSHAADSAGGARRWELSAADGVLHDLTERLFATMRTAGISPLMHTQVTLTPTQTPTPTPTPTPTLPLTLTLTQASAESSICIVVNSDDAQCAKRARDARQSLSQVETVGCGCASRGA